MPVAQKKLVVAELERLEKLGVITKVDTPTDWVSAFLVVPKPNGKMRLCLDQKPLNKALKRNHNHMPTFTDVLLELSKSRIFSVADAKDEFWQTELDEYSSYLTTFGTPIGKIAG